MSITIEINEDAEIVYLVCRYMKRKRINYNFVDVEEDKKKYLNWRENDKSKNRRIRRAL